MEAPAKLREVVRFEEFELSVSSAELTKYGLKIRLQEQPFQILVMLLGRPGQVVTREELRARLWPGDKTFVDFEVGLNSAVLRLRNALGDTSEHPRFVETVPRRGYRFIGALEEPEAISESAAQNSSPVKESPSILPLEQKVLAVAAQPAIHPVKRRLWISITATVGVIAVALVLNWNGWRQGTPARSTPAHIHSLAVLPLENLTGDATQDYVADGMTDALITDLAQISSLKVISRTSVMRYKGTKKALPEIGRELNVDAIVEGAVVRSGERVRVDAQLIEANTDRHVWASTYERNLGDVIALQNEIAQAIAKGVQVRLTPQEQAHLLRADSVDPQTYELYLKGRYFWRQRTGDSVRKGINYLQQAIQRSPNYALAYAALAEAYVVRYDVPPQERYSAAKAAARRALEIDDSLAEAHNALAASLFWYDWDWTGAEKEFKRALALNPNYAQAHQWYGQLQKALGRKTWPDEVQRAGELDPLSVLTFGGGWYLESGQYDRALELIRKKLELYPNAPNLYSDLSEVYVRKQMYQEAIENDRKSVALSAGEPKYLSDLAYTYAISGKRKEAVQILQQLTLLSRRRYISPYQIAGIYAGLNKTDLAFRWLDRALAEHCPTLVFLKSPTSIEMDNLRSDPRYAELERRVGLPM